MFRQLIACSSKTVKLCCRFSTTTVSTEKRVSTPVGYRKPNAYALFYKDNFIRGNQIKDEGNRIALLWKSASENVKKEYSKKSDEVGKSREIEFSNLPESDRDAKLMKHKERLEKRRKNRIQFAIKEFKKSTNYPTRPLNAYQFYIKEKMQNKKISSLSEGKDALSELAKSWKNLTDDEKKPYVDKTSDVVAKYKKDVKEWKAVNSKMYKQLRSSHIQNKVARKGGLYNTLKARGLRKMKAASTKRSAKKRTSTTKTKM